MPRIAAALGVLALVVVSIGVNIVRYPVVAEMVGPPSRLPQPVQTAEASLPAEPAGPTPPEFVAAPRPTLPATPVVLPSEPAAIADSGTDRPGKAGQGAAASGAGLGGEPSAPSLPPLADFVSLPQASPVPADAAAEEQLVPLVRASTDKGGPDQPAGAAFVRHLPPVEQAVSVATPQDQAASWADAGPVYPSTDAE